MPRIIQREDDGPMYCTRPRLCQAVFYGIHLDGQWLGFCRSRRVCAETCRACGEECRRHDKAHCQRCAEACKRCAKECEKMDGRSVQDAPLHFPPQGPGVKAASTGAGKCMVRISQSVMAAANLSSVSTALCSSISLCLRLSKMVRNGVVPPA